MKFSEKWLREWVNPSISTQELMDQVTMAGLEVDGSEKVADDFTGIVVGKIESAEQHPNADKLRVCTVSDGSESFQVVCGAPNARAGINVAFAKIGAVLGGDFKIKKAKLRQVESFGMLCSVKELGLGEDHDGIMELASDAPIGQDFREYMSLDDTIIEVDLTPNRADCLSLRGIAREVGVLNNMDVNHIDIPAVKAEIDDTFDVSLQAPEVCPNYVGRVIKDVDVTAKTPLWMVERLRRSEIRSIDPVVDITNYVLIELGQPMHGFDLDQLKGSIQVRMADGKESVVLLDGQEVTPREDTLLIADQTGPLAIAGVMGGENSGVTDKTKNVFFESAFFVPEKIAGKARSYGLHTDSSHRFERGVDYDLQTKAIERATQLLVEICGGKPGPVIEVNNPSFAPKARQVVLTKDKAARVLGMEMAGDQVEEILTRLGLTLIEKDDNSWTFGIPSYRFDMSIAEDLIEELARVYGYNNLPITAPTGEMKIQPHQESLVELSKIQNQLVARGFQEAITYSFVEEKLQAMLEPNFEAIALANPISAELAVMRTSTWAGLVKALQHNLSRQQDRVKFFETGLTFKKDGEQIIQEPVLGGLISGAKLPKGWTAGSESFDFFDLKGDLESVLDLVIGQEFKFVPGKHPALHPGQTARIELNGKLVGFIGQMHPSIQRDLGIKQSVFLFEIKKAAIEQAHIPVAKPLSKFPETGRDLAVVVDKTTPVDEVLDTVKQCGGENMTSLVLFDLYQGKGIDPDRKSVAMGLTWQHASRTLNDDEINEIMDNVIKTLSDRFAATLRS